MQRPAPDPFTLPEAEAILGQLGAREDAQVVNYFTAAFFGGFRPSEQIALRWTDVDFQQRTVRVQRAVVRGQAKENTKTYLVRDVAALPEASRSTLPRAVPDAAHVRNARAYGRCQPVIHRAAARTHECEHALSRLFEVDRTARISRAEGRS